MLIEEKASQETNHRRGHGQDMSGQRKKWHVQRGGSQMKCGIPEELKFITAEGDEKEEAGGGKTTGPSYPAKELESIHKAGRRPGIISSKRMGFRKITLLIVWRRDVQSRSNECPAYCLVFGGFQRIQVSGL